MHCSYLPVDHGLNGSGQAKNALFGATGPTWILLEEHDRILTEFRPPH